MVLLLWSSLLVVFVSGWLLRLSSLVDVGVVSAWLLWLTLVVVVVFVGVITLLHVIVLVSGDRCYYRFC